LDLDGLNMESNVGNPRIVVGVDDGERVENGRSTIQGLAEKKHGAIACVMNSHAPTMATEVNFETEDGIGRRVPRKTAVESDQRRVNREGKAEWTAGIGMTPYTSLSGTTGTARKLLWDMEELSDPRRSGQKSVDRATRSVSTIDGAWNDRRRPDRYDYYREGHAINRASKVMATCSLNQESGKMKSTSLVS